MTTKSTLRTKKVSSIDSKTVTSLPKPKGKVAHGVLLDGADSIEYVCGGWQVISAI